MKKLILLFAFCILSVGVYSTLVKNYINEKNAMINKNKFVRINRELTIAYSLEKHFSSPQYANIDVRFYVYSWYKLFTYMDKNILNITILIEHGGLYDIKWSDIVDDIIYKLYRKEIEKDNFRIILDVGDKISYIGFNQK